MEEGFDTASVFAGLIIGKRMNLKPVVERRDVGLPEMAKQFFKPLIYVNLRE